MRACVHACMHAWNALYGAITRGWAGEASGSGTRSLGKMLLPSANAAKAAKAAIDAHAPSAMRGLNESTRSARRGNRSVKMRNPLLTDSDKVQEYQAMVGSIQYLACISRTDLSFAAAQLARYMSCPTQEHWHAAKHVLRYLRKTSGYKLKLGACRDTDAAGEGFKAVIYSDSDFANCPDTRRSVTGYIMLLGGSPVVWASRRQPVVKKSTTAAEYVAASMATDEVMHFTKLLADLDIAHKPIPLRQDNQATAHSLVNPVEDGKTKYIEIHYHFVRER